VSEIEKLVQAFPDGKGTAKTEEEEGHHERPEIHVLAMTEAVRAVGRALTQAHAHEEEDLVAGIRDGMKRLREHRRASRGGGGHPLHDREGGVAEQCRGDCRLRLGHRRRSREREEAVGSWPSGLEGVALTHLAGVEPGAEPSHALG